MVISVELYMYTRWRQARGYASKHYFISYEYGYCTYY